MRIIPICHRPPLFEAVLIPHGVIGEYSTYRSHVNAHILHIKGAILDDPRIRDIKKFINS